MINKYDDLFIEYNILKGKLSETCIKRDEHKIINEKLITDLNYQNMITLDQDNLVNKLNTECNTMKNEINTLKNNANILNRDNNKLELEYNRANF